MTGEGILITKDFLMFIIAIIAVVSAIATTLASFYSVKHGLNGTIKDIKEIKTDLNGIIDIITKHNNKIGNIEERCNIEFPSIKKRLDKLEDKIDKSG